VTCAKQGDPEGLHFLYVRYAPDVRDYVASFVHEDREAEDITQSVFTKLVTAINEYEHREEPFSAWILRVARNAALDHMRQADDPHQES
jgi:RNA polymerase sigma-70 factor (ECF subfamily)